MVNTLTPGSIRHARSRTTIPSAWKLVQIAARRWKVPSAQAITSSAFLSSYSAIIWDKCVSSPGFWQTIQLPPLPLRLANRKAPRVALHSRGQDYYVGLAVYTCAWAGARDPGPALAPQCQQIQVQMYAFATFFTNMVAEILTMTDVFVN